ncbi:MAG: hypothetical protein COA78_15770 [Blastopirellula sp.]|nr:MAG: hypothetical protein COA78_15770 [Blastopirellula sp.]
MIDCIEETVLPVDQRVLDLLLHSEYWNDLRFDPEYLATLSSIHGGTPTKQYFTDSTGNIRRIGWFVSMFDEHSKLPGDFQEDHMYQEQDTRVIDRSLPYLLDGESSIYRPLEDGPVRYYPFAALYNKESVPFTLCWHFTCGQNSICFDTSTDPFSVVLCEYDKAVEAFMEYDRELDNRYDYSFLAPIADSFREFAKMLRSTP